ncbi:MAG: TolC family protein [Polyangiales bacterium]
MSIYRYTVVIGVAGMLCGLATRPAYAQAPPGAESKGKTSATAVAASADQEDDAAAKALRSLYVPDGLTSDQAVRRIVATSPDIERTQALVKEAKGGALQAMSGLVPRLELIGRYSRLSPVDNPTFEVPGLGSLTFPSLTQQFASDATLIYSFTQSLAESMPAYRAAKKNKIAARYQIEAENNNVAFDARQAYYEYARAEAGLAVANFALEAAVSQRKETEALVEAGSAARVDLMRVQAQEEAARVAVEQANLGVEVATRSLQALMHTEALPSLGEDLSEPVTGFPTETEKTLQERAYRNRPDLLALRTYIDATTHQLKSANGGRLPDFLVRASAEYSNPNLRVIPQEKRFVGTWEVGAVVRWAPNDTVNAQGRSRQLQGALQRAYADVDSLEIAVRVEVAQGYHGMLAAQAAMQSARLGLNASREGYRVTREQLQAGIVNTTTLLQAQSELIRAQVDVVDSAIGLRVAKAQLRRAIGEMP